MEKALEVAKEKGGLGVWFPSPSEYEPLAFLSALSEHVAVSFEDFYDEKTGRLTRASRFRFFTTAILGYTMAYFALILLVFSNMEGGSSQQFPAFLTARNLLLGSVVIAGFAVTWFAFKRRRRDREGLGRLRVKAEQLRNQVRFTVTATESDELDLGAKYSGVGGLLKRARERQLVERPATLSSLIHNFRAFVRATADEIEGPVVIAIDELDKMSDSTRVAQLLRDIKGIFEIRGACFLVSLSDEAAQALELGAVRARNEFNSSFYTVISMPPFSPAASLELLRRRDPAFNARSGRAIGILTGGISRELVRVAELVRLRVGVKSSVGDVIRTVLGEELGAFRAWVLQTANARSKLSPLGDEARIAVFDAIEAIRAELRQGEVDGFEGAERRWDLNGVNAIWSEHFAEEWRRLLVRIEVAAQMTGNPALIDSNVKAQGLQRTIQISSTSAAVGRRYMEATLAPAGGP
jgi:hypothetical protein